MCHEQPTIETICLSKAIEHFINDANKTKPNQPTIFFKKLAIKQMAKKRNINLALDLFLEPFDLKIFLKLYGRHDFLD